MLTSNSFLALAAAVPAFATTLETTAALDLVAGVDGDNAVFGPLAMATAVLRQPTPYAAHDAAPSPPKNTDLGALTLKQRQLALACPTECSPGFFGYCDGVSIGTETCGEDCCTGLEACSKFTGCVKGDGSCSGDYACYSAKVPIIENSCRGQSACYTMGRFGSVGVLTHSCNGVQACYNVAYGNDSTVGPIKDSCNRDKACYRIMYSNMKSITKTCNNDAHKPCAILGNPDVEYFNFGHLTKFVHAETGEKYKRDSIGSIEDCHAACVNDIDCNGIKWKEHTGSPCRFFGGEISDNKCNGRNVCITVE